MKKRIYEDEVDIYDNSISEYLDEDRNIENEEGLAKSYTLFTDDDMLLDEEALEEYSLKDSILEEDYISDEDGVEGDSLYSPDERLRMFSDSILSCCIGNKEIKGYALNRLMSVTNPRLFRDENYILFSVLYNFRTKLRRINIDEEFVRLYLNRNRDLVQRSKDYIDINAYGEVDGSIELGYISGVLKHFIRLRGMEELSEIEFETVFEKYLIEFKALEAAKIYTQGSLILTEGLHIGRRLYSGFEDSQSYVKRKLAEVEGLVDMNMGTGFVKQSEVLLQRKEDGKKPIKVGDFGKLKALNDVYGGIYTGMFYQFLAPPKSGKTKICARLAHTASVLYGTNVTVWAQEGGNEAWAAQQRAIHFDYTYNEGSSVTEKKYGITQEVILKDEFPSDELKQLELSSKIDLASNPSYGSVDYVDRPFEVETFIEDIDTSVKENGSQMVIIDYLQIIDSARGISERERISEAYRKLLVYCKNNNVAVISPGQYKQDTFNSLIAGGTSNADMRTSGGGSSEVLRTPDVIIAMWATTQDLLNNHMEFLSMPCRMNRAFPKINAHVDLGTCQFISYDS